ncbi:MAG: sigma-70 family RNA polymerase sigma factor [Bacteroidales bacterium]|nr:sigma-70 family RNA polymerase sigma factor [Bacteroidales bacterium]
MSERENAKVARWIEESRQGRPRAQHKLFRHFYSPMFAICMRYAGSTEEAEDMLNEGFLKVFSNLDKYEDTGSFSAWMRKVMTNAALDYRRKYGLKFDTADLELVANTTLVSVETNDAISRMSVDELVRLVQQLPPTMRTVFNLFIMEGYSHAEIATELGISESTSAWHLNHARNRLKKEIMKLYNE